MSAKLSVDIERTALLVMDYQRGICTADGPLGDTPVAREVRRRDVLPKLSTALNKARELGLNILHVGVGLDRQHPVRTSRTQQFARFEQEGRLRVGSLDAEFCAEATPLAGEPVITKTGVDPFVGTALGAALTARGADTLLLAGVATNFVVESAARHAADSGYAVQILEDVCASREQEIHEFTVQYILPAFGEISSTPELLGK